MFIDLWFPSDNLKIYFSQKLHFSLNVSLLRFVKILNQIFELQRKYARIWYKGESRCDILQTRIEIFSAILSLFSLRRGIIVMWLFRTFPMRRFHLFSVFQLTLSGSLVGSVNFSGCPWIRFTNLLFEFHWSSPTKPGCGCKQYNICDFYLKDIL